MDAEAVFRVLADIVAGEEEKSEDIINPKESLVRRQRHLADLLNLILMTAPETESLRQKLTRLNSRVS